MKILLIRLRSIGDIIQCTPAFSAVRKLFESSSIDLMIDGRFSELVIENSNLDGFLLYDNKNTGFLPRLKYDFNFLKIIRRRRYDMVIDFHGIPRTAWFSYLSGAKIRPGYNYTGRGHLYTSRIEPPVKFSVHSARNQINLLKAIPEDLKPAGCFMDDYPLDTFMSARFAEKELDDFLAPLLNAPDALKKDMNEKFDIITYHISPSNNFKKWHPLNYAALINMCERHPALSKRRFFHIIIGGANDRNEFDKIASAVKTIKGRLVSACGLISLGAVYNLAKKSACYIGPDSGPLHIAAAADAFTIGLFGPTNIETFAPPSNRFSGIFDSAISCRPCDQKKCPYDFKCMKNIKAGKVFDLMLKRLLNAK